MDPETSLGVGPDGLELRLKDVQRQRGRLADVVKQGRGQPLILEPG